MHIGKVTLRKAGIAEIEHRAVLGRIIPAVYPAFNINSSVIPYCGNSVPHVYDAFFNMIGEVAAVVSIEP